MKITLTLAEVQEIFKKHFDFEDDFELIIESNDTKKPVVEKPQVSQYEPAPDGTLPDEDGWFYVPAGWDKTKAPFGFNKERILVEYRNKDKETDTTDRWEWCWVQEDQELDIVRFKLA